MGEEKYQNVVKKIAASLGANAPASGNPFRRFAGQQFRVLQGDGVSLDTVGDMLASLLANGFCANCCHFGSGGGLLQKLNRDSLSVAFKCCAMYVGDKNFPVGKDPIAGGKKSYGGNPPVIRGADGVLRNRGEYNDNGEMLKALPMSVEEFKNGAAGDELKCVFENGSIKLEQNFHEIKERAKITKLDTAVRQALDNLDLKMDFLKRMGSDESIAIRLAEASTGSKWSHRHPTKLAELKAKYPAFNAAFDKLGLTDSLDSVEILQKIKENYVCDKRMKKAIMSALAKDDPAAAAVAMGTKIVVTL